MNKFQRKQLQELAGKLEGIKYDIESIKEEEEEKLSNMEEKFSGTEKYQNMESGIEYLEYAVDGFDEIFYNIEVALNS